MEELCRKAPLCHSLAAVLEQPGPSGVNIIAEVKRASPSKGAICPQAVAAEVAEQYQAAGAAAVSVLTDEKFFCGSLEDLRQVKRAVDLPVLRKDFIISGYQVLEARAFGADAVLLIVKILSRQRLSRLLAKVEELGMQALVEVHDSRELDIAMDVGAHLIAINNRDLKTFKTNLDNAIVLAKKVKSWQVAVAASAIASPRDIRRSCMGGIFNFLVGESLMRADDRRAYLRELLHGWKKDS